MEYVTSYGPWMTKLYSDPPGQTQGKKPANKSGKPAEEKPTANPPEKGKSAKDDKLSATSSKELKKKKNGGETAHGGRLVSDEEEMEEDYQDLQMTEGDDEAEEPEPTLGENLCFLCLFVCFVLTTLTYAMS